MDLLLANPHAEVSRAGTSVPRRKLSAPAFVPTQLRRDAVGARLAASLAPLVVVRAPAGFGKTTVLAQYCGDLRGQGTPTAWVTCDESDNDPARFLKALGEVLGVPAASQRGKNAVAALRTRMEAIGAERGAFALFLDDFEMVQHTETLSVVRELIASAPPQARIFIASRVCPALCLARLRSKGQLLEILTDDLRFSLKETHAFFQRSGCGPVRGYDIDRLHAHTEGWVAGLWLASLALQRQAATPAFAEWLSCATALIADYLAEDVLDRQPPETRRFLLRSSALQRLDARACDAVLAQHGGAPDLAGMARSGLFLEAADDKGRWRYHRLFAAFLRDRFAQEMPAELPGLHRAASDWYASQQQHVEAIGHAVAGGYHARALDLLEPHASDFLASGHMRLLSRWFAVLPVDEVLCRPALCMAAVWSMGFAGCPAQAMQLLDRSGWTVSDPAARAHVLALRPLLLGMMDRYEEAAELGRANLRSLPTGHAFTDAALTTVTAHASLIVDAPAQSRQLVVMARTAPDDAAAGFNRMFAQTVEGLLDLAEGQLRQAAARFRIAAHPIAGSTLGHAYAGVQHAAALFEAGDAAQAEQLLEAYMPLACDAGLRDQMILGYVMQARMAFDHRQLDRAWELLGTLEQAGDARGLPRMSASARLERARLLILQGHGEAAFSELTLASRSGAWERVARLRFPAHEIEDLELGWLRWGLAFGDLPSTLQQIVQAKESAKRRKKLLRVLKLELLQAIALHRMGKEGPANERFAAVARGAAAQGFFRLLVDEGAMVAQLAAAWVARQDAADRAARLPERELLGRVLQRFGACVDKQAAQGIAPEQLTRTEIRMLRLVADGYSNVELAGKLFVSDSTVRTHLRNINQKLNCASRTHAVAIARRLGVIV